MPLTKFDVCSNALVAIGADTITDFGGGSTESAVASQLYQTTIDNWLTLYDWRFASKQSQLSRLSEAPTALWSAAYQAPAGIIKMKGVFVNDRPIEYDRYQDKIYCNAQTTDVVVADFVWSVGVDYWPPYFVMLAELALMKRFSFALAGKLDLKATVDADLEQQFQLAKNADSRQQTAKRIDMGRRGSILEARRS